MVLVQSHDHTLFVLPECSLCVAWTSALWHGQSAESRVPRLLHQLRDKSLVMPKGLVTVFGGSGFVGQYAARALVKAGYRVRVAVRRPHLAGDVRLAGTPGWVDIVQANVRDRASVDRALEGADAAVNLVGILFEKGKQSFEAAHRDGSIIIAEAVAAAGIDRLVQVSSIGADPKAKSHYARTKGEAEAAVREHVPGAVILRPSVIFGPEDDFFNRFAAMASAPISNVLPFLPAIGGGKTKIQPVFAGDVANAIVAAVTHSDVEGKTYELGGPRVYSFNEIYDIVTQTIDKRRFKFWLPFLFAKPIGYAFAIPYRYVPPLSWGFFGEVPITADQVEQLKKDNVVTEGALGLADLGVTELESVEVIVPTYLWRFRAYGEFYQSQES